jgi:hypothetical protein
MKKFRILPYLLAIFLPALVAFGIFFQFNNTTTQAPPAVWNETWAMQPLWDDGLAEVATYDAERMIYGKIRQFEMTIITVKETFNKGRQVKTDDYTRNDLFDVLKVNQFARIPTDQYPYHFMNSTFVWRNQPTLLYKATNTSQEWCGQTFQEISTQPRWTLRYNSYFDGEASGEKPLNSGFLVEDQLPVALRSVRFQEGLTWKMSLYPSLMSSHAVVANPETVTATVEAVEGESLWKVEVQWENARLNHYYFQQAYPNLMVAMDTWDGRILTLKATSRYAYWQP